MSAADKIQAARALIEPLTGHTPGPWEIDAPEDESVEIGAGILSIAGLYESAPDALPDARLIAAAPALRDTVADLADLADAQAQENARLKGIIAKMDAHSPLADKTCDEPGITLSEAVMRQWPELRVGLGR